VTKTTASAQSTSDFCRVLKYLAHRAEAYIRVNGELRVYIL